jgi:hypothetical protein
MSYLLPAADDHLVGSYALDVARSDQALDVELILRPPRATDPPALVSFPLLFAERAHAT